MSLGSEPGGTSLDLAKIRFFTGMQSEVSFKIALFKEGLVALGVRTHKVAVAIMLVHVDFQALRTTVRLVAAENGT